MKKYKVWVKSVPGFFTQYSGKVTVSALNDDDAISRVLRKLRTGAFPDRTDSMWKIESVERIF